MPFALLGLAACSPAETEQLAPTVEDLSALEARVDAIEAQGQQPPPNDWLQKGEEEKRIARLEARVQQLEMERALGQ